MNCKLVLFKKEMEDNFKRRPNEISLSRVKTIMKSSPDVENVSQESVFLVTKATEMFMKHMVEEALKVTENSRTLDYSHVSHLVDTTEELAFLREIVPKKTTLRAIEEYQKQKGLNVQRPGTSPPHSEISFLSDDDTYFENLEGTSSQAHVPPKSQATSVASKRISETFPESSPQNFDSSSSVPRYGSSSQSKAGPSTNSDVCVVDLVEEDKNSDEECVDLESDPDSSTEVSMGKSLGHEWTTSPMSVITISSDSRTPSPSPSYSSLSPDEQITQDVKAVSSRTSDCEFIE